MEAKVLNLYPIDYPFETLVDRVQKEKLILNPDFQRKYKWDKEGEERGSKFIESCLMRIPLPACYFAEDENGNHIVIDGVQRITTISRFLKDEFQLEGLTVYEELNGKRFSELGAYKNELESTTIRCVILRKENPEGLVQEIFARLNQGAVQLSAQEIRHAIFPGSLDNLLRQLSGIDLIAKFQQGENKDSRESEELVLRFFTLDSDLDDYDGRLSKYMDNYMKCHRNIDDAEIEEKKRLFTETLNKCTMVFGDDAFINVTKEKKRQSVALYDLLMWSFSKREGESLRTHKDAIVGAFNNLCSDAEFEKTLSGGLQQKTAIKKRRELWEAKLDSII